MDSANFYNSCQLFSEIESSEPARLESWGILSSKMKEFGAFGALGESPKPSFFCIFIGDPLKLMTFNDFIDIFRGWCRLIGH